MIAQADPDGPRERTGETFLGAIIGDHVKFAILSRIMTGAVLHTGCMFAQCSPIEGCVPPFTWATDEGHKIYRLSKFLDVASAVMARREVEPTQAYLERINQLHSDARDLRQRLGGG